MLVNAHISYLGTLKRKGLFLNNSSYASPPIVSGYGLVVLAKSPGVIVLVEFFG